MSRNKRVTTLRAQNWNRIKNTIGSVKCYHCDKDLEVGDDICSTGSFGSEYGRRYYCIKCARVKSNLKR